MAKALAWFIWSVPAAVGLVTLLFLVGASSAVPGVAMGLVMLIALAAAGLCLGGSLWLMLRRNYGAAILLVCMLLPMTFALGIGLEEAQLWMKEKGR